MPAPATRPSGPPGSFNPADNQRHAEAGPSGQATSEAAGTKTSGKGKGKGKAPAANVPADDMNSRIQALTSENNELRTRLSSFNHRSMDTPIRISVG
ncbi:hypothetical protein N7461_007186 [Penicillium sp. DV-2018c]|nr:hypothetical protein N7461_007186 [Penicillium sp. DV-2018c]